MKVPKPRKKILSEKNRDTLRALARRKVQADPATEKALVKAKAKHDELFDEVGAMLKAKIERLFNAEDMTVLAKYGHTESQASTRVQLKKMSEDAAEKGTCGGFFHWRFKDEDRPAIPRWRFPDSLKWEDREEWRRDNVPDYNNVLLGGADEKKYLKYREASEALSLAEANKEQSRRDLLQDYMALILSARTYEDVLEVWPEASEVRNDIVPGACTAITAFSQDAAERIKADFARRFRDELKRMGFHVKTETRRSQYRVIRNDDAVSTYCASGTSKRARATQQTIDNLEAIDDSTLSPEALAKKERKLARLKNAMVGYKERPYGVGLPGPDPLRPKLT